MSAEFSLATAEQLERILRPIQQALRSPEAFTQLLERYGWQVDPATIDLDEIEPVLAISVDLNEALRLLAQVSLPIGGAPPLETYIELVAALRRVLAQLGQLAAGPLPPPALVHYPWAAFFANLVQGLIADYLDSYQPELFAFLLAFGVVKEERIEADGADGRITYIQPRLEWQRLGSILRDPLAHLKERFDWNSASQTWDYNALLSLLRRIVQVLGFKAELQVPNTRRIATYYDPANPALAQLRELQVTLVDTEISAENLLRIAFSILPIPPQNSPSARPTGIVLAPSVVLPRSGASWIDKPFSIALKGALQADEALLLEIRPEGLRLVPRWASTTVGESSATLAFDTRFPQYPLILVGAEGGPRLQVQHARAGLLLGGTPDAPDVTFEAVLEQGQVVLPFAEFGWDSLRWQIGPGRTRLAITNLRIQTEIAPDTPLVGDLSIGFENGQFTVDSVITLREPKELELPVFDFHLDDTCLALSWTEANLNRLLSLLPLDLSDRGEPGNSQVTLRLIFGQSRKELRLDWDTGDTPRPYTLPGVDLTLPAHARFSLVLTSTEGGVFNRLAVILTLQRAAPLQAGSAFPWERDGEREIQNDDQRAPDEPPLLSLSLTPQRAEGISLLLFELALDELKMPTFFRQLVTPLPAINFQQSATLRALSDLGRRSLSADDWLIDFALNLENIPFTLPFLKQKNGEADLNQFIEIHTPTFPPNPIDFEAREIRFSVGVTLHIGPLELDTACDLSFNWETFALRVKHDEGIALFSEKPTLGPEKFLGLDWQLTGAPITSHGRTRYHLFTLATKNGQYQIQQAPGAQFELAYTGLSQDPIVFAVRDFALGPNGLNVTAEVLDRPTKLNGLETSFRFSNSRLVISENQINDFTIAGSGPLPPALVGDATADIFLQFRQQPNGNIKLVEGKAELRGKKLLDCPGTRFQFSVDGLGLRFVDDGKFHLYFTVTGSAQFTPALGDDLDGPLGLLGKIKIDLVECPLTGDAKVIGKHVKFLMELPKPKSFSFLGCFEMELRAIGFVPQAPEFGGDGAMEVTGQLKFAQGAGDTPDPRPDYHRLLIGLPEPGSFIPRIHFKRIAANLNLGAAFRLSGMVEFVDEPNQTGMLGEGMLQIQGLPTFAASFAFLRVRRDEHSPWLRAWFIYVEARQVNFMIPVVQLFIREVGLGFGYRYTIAGIKAADATNDVRELIKQLQVLSRTQGDLARVDRWSLDLEEPGQDPRWTIVLRAMISQTSAAPSPLSYNELAESQLPCTFLFDAVIAFRSDLTFLMVVRAWLNTNYVDYVNNVGGIRESPLLSGFVLLSPRQKRFLAHAANTPGVKPGIHPPLPEFIRQAIANSRFSATLLIEPGLLHYELGWPNMLRWSDKFGPLSAEFQGGFIFRVSTTELVIGTSFLARGSLEIKATFERGIVGVQISANARIAYGARYIGVVDFIDPLGRSALYGAIGLEVQIRLAITLWLKVKLLVKTIKLSFRLSLTIGFTASLEAAIMGRSLPGIRGTGTVSFSALGHNLHHTVRIGVREEQVQRALERTAPFLNVGLEATEVEPVPGTQGAVRAAHNVTDGRAIDSLLGVRQSRRIRPLAAQEQLAATGFKVPGYLIFVIRAPGSDGWTYFVLLPRGEQPATDVDGNPTTMTETGFLPPPPDAVTPVEDFILRIPALDPAEHYRLEQFVPLAGSWMDHTATLSTSGPAEISWRANWNASIIPASEDQVLDPATGQVGDPTPSHPLSLGDYLSYAFKQAAESTPDHPVLQGDPDPLPLNEDRIEDPRVQNPSDNSFEAAVRGALEQFSGSPFFKRDLSQPYEQLLAGAFSNETTIYGQGGQVRARVQADELPEEQNNQQAHQLRGMIVHDIIADLRAYADAGSAGEREQMQGESIAFQMGLVFRTRSDDNVRPAWLDQIVTTPETTPLIRQRSHPGAARPTDGAQPVRTFNVLRTDFNAFPPQFQRVRQYSDASTIAITWDLSWDHALDPHSTSAQSDPDHHLVHYHVRRRALDSREREAVYTVKPGHVLHRRTQADGDEVLSRLLPRFQIVDYFTDETAEDLAALPAEGHSYLYTITPIDFAGNAGRPLSLVATRRPNQPPLVPVDGELTVRYRLSTEMMASSEELVTPRVVAPRQVFVTWTEPAAPSTGPSVPIGAYWLIFRRESTLPIGSYGLDSTTQRSAGKLLPTSNARPLPNDVKIPITARGPRQERSAIIPLDVLRSSGVLPEENWRPEAWRVFIQTASVNQVPSALAPVQLRLVVEALPDDTDVTAAPDDESEELAARREERRPAELEWLPRPLRLPVLPPEDQQVQVGPAHFPMPRADDESQRLRFRSEAGAGIETMISFRAHPAGARALRFRWNQGPSEQPRYPLDLHAGFHLLELDIDAHTSETFASPAKLADALRLLQDIQMLPGADLLLAPGDTLNTSQWEAWYPGTLLRSKAHRVPGSEIHRGPWYSWQDSYLEWPAWDGLTVPQGRRTSQLHPFLQRIVDLLSRRDQVEDLRNRTGRSLASYHISLQASPPIQPNDLAGFLESCPPRIDPYGWGVLQRFGLSVALTLHDPQSGDVVSGERLVAALQDVLTALAEDQQSGYPEYQRHLHVELLFQPGRSVRLAEGASRADDLLGLIQISLRPTVRQHLRYWAASLAGAANSTVDLLLTIPPGAPCSLINQADLAGGQVELLPREQAIVRTIRLPIDGETRLLLRAAQMPMVHVAVTLQEEPPPDALAPFGELLTYDGSTRQLIAKRPLAAEERDRLRAALSPGDHAAADALFALRGLTPFGPTHEHTAYFTVPVEVLAARFARWEVDPATGMRDPLGEQWLRLKQYVETLNSSDPKVPGTQRASVPTAPGDIAAALPDLLDWMARFFEASGALPTDDPGGLAATQAGPWVASAYPRTGAPVYATPDEDSRLTYFHRIEDRWAHTYRYYFQPYGRYELLWHSLRASPTLFPGRPVASPADLSPVIVDPAGGGLDVVLDRTHPVAAPLVLSSSRLDEPSSPASPATPGRTWEVIVAQHPEQALIERNQTLARQLAFRQVAFTLLRRFAYTSWIDQLQQLVPDSAIVIRPVEHQFPGIPTSYPVTPDHIDLSGTPLYAGLARSLDLPERVGVFGQGVLALQWEALPFFYEHRLLLIAQATSAVSKINHITQRDFTYCSPTPAGRTAAQDAPWQPQPPYGLTDAEPISLRARLLRIPLRRLWDSLPADAQLQWPGEAPDPVGAEDEHGNPITGRKLAALPDLEVTYQLVERFSGNIEVQAELFYDQTAQRFAVRQLGRRFLAQLVGLAPPDTPQDDFVLAATLQQISEEQLAGSYVADDLPDPTRHKVVFKNGSFLSFVGLMTRADRDNLHALMEGNEQDRAIIQHIYRSWDSQEAVGEVPDDLPLALHDVVDFPEPADCPLVWHGTITSEEMSALQLIDGDAAFQRALRDLATRARSATSDGFTVAVAPLGLDQIPGGVSSKIGFTIEPSTNSYTQMIWTGPLFDDEAAILRRWAQIPEFAAAVARLIKTRDEVELIHELPPENKRPLQSDLSAALASKLTIAPVRIAWRGLPLGDTQLSIVQQRIAGLQILGEAGDAAFRAALGAIVAAFGGKPLDAPVTISLDLPPENLRPTQAALSPALAAHLTIEPARLRWRGPLPSASLRAELDSLMVRGDAAFQAALGAIVAAFGDQPSEDPLTIDRDLPVESRRPLQADLPPVLAGLLTIEPTRLRWSGLPAGNDQRQQIEGLIQELQMLTQRGDAAFQTALGAIVAAFSGKPLDAPVTISRDLPPENLRPTQAALSPALAAHLMIEPTRLGWRGRPAGVGLLQALTLLAQKGDPPFQSAMSTMSVTLADMVTQIALSLPVRPASPPEVLRPKLLIGRAVVRYHGLMSVDEGHALQAVFDTEPGRQAIQRLFSASLACGMRGRSLYIRSRRGNAAPSELQALEPEEL